MMNANEDEYRISYLRMDHNARKSWAVWAAWAAIQLPMRSKVLAEGNLLGSGKRAEMAFVDFLGFDVEGEMTGEIPFDRCRVVAQIAAVGLPVDHRVGVARDVRLVDAIVELLLHPATSATAAAGRNGRKSFLVRVILHVRH